MSSTRQWCQPVAERRDLQLFLALPLLNSAQTRLAQCPGSPQIDLRSWGGGPALTLPKGLDSETWDPNIASVTFLSRLSDMPDIINHTSPKSEPCLEPYPPHPDPAARGTKSRTAHRTHTYSCPRRTACSRPSSPAEDSVWLTLLPARHTPAVHESASIPGSSRKRSTET